LNVEKIGLFYGSSTCYTEFVAEKIVEKVGSEYIDLYNISSEPINTIQQYSHLIFGIPTWDYGELQEDWDKIWDDLDTLCLNGKTCAIFGLGDQIGYPTWFQDALGYLYHKLKSVNATMIGHWPNTGYEFSDSKALTQDGSHFLGLALDEENQTTLTDTRLDQWLEQVQHQFTNSMLTQTE